MPLPFASYIIHTLAVTKEVPTLLCFSSRTSKVINCSSKFERVDFHKKRTIHFYFDQKTVIHLSKNNFDLILSALGLLLLPVQGLV